MSEQPQREEEKVESTSSAFDLQFVIERAKRVITDPKGVWSEVKNDRGSILDVYKQYILVILLVPAVFEFINMTVVGVHIPFGVGTVTWGAGAALGSVLFQYLSKVVGIAVGAVIFEKLAPRFDASLSRVDGVRLLGYSITPAAIGSVFLLVPGLGLLTMAFGIYGLYVCFQGLPVMSGVSTEKRPTYFFLSMVVMIIAMMVITAITAVVSPSVPRQSSASTAKFEDLEKVELPGGKTVDLDQFRKSMEHLKKALPNEE